MSAVAILIGVLVLYVVLVIIAVKYPDSSFGKSLSVIVPKFLYNIGTTTPPPPVEPPTQPPSGTQPAPPL